MGVTASDIAKHVGLSRQTVAFILGDRPHLFREETRQRVFAAAEKLGYRRNAAAVAMGRGRYNAIGLLQATDLHLGAVHSNFLRAVMEETRAAGMHMSMGQVDDAKLTDESAVQALMKEWAVDGLVISYVANYPEQLVEILQRYRLPAIWMNVKRGSDAVYADDYGGARDATEHLLRLGHRDIAYVCHHDGPHYSSHDRWAAYADTMRAAGLQPRRVGRDLSHLPVAAVEAHAIRADELGQLLRGQRPSAVLLNDEMTAPIFVYLCGLLGIKLGPDLSLVNFTRDSSPVLAQVLTSAVVPTGDLGHATVPMLLRKIADRASDLPSISVSYRLQYPEATCRLRVS